MANILEKIEAIRSAILGLDVRKVIADAIEAINNEVVDTTERQTEVETTFQAVIDMGSNPSAEVEQARGDEDNLGDRLDKHEMSLSEIPSQLGLKTDRSYTDAQLLLKRDKITPIEFTDFAQSAKTAMTGGSVAVVGLNAVLETNIVDNQVTPRKAAFFDKVEKYINLVDMQKSVAHSTISATGTIDYHIAWNSYVSENFIPVVEGDILNSLQGLYFTVGEYDVNFVFLRRTTNSPVVMGVNTKNIKLQYSDGLVITKNTGIPTEVLTPEYYIKDKNISNKLKYDFNLFNVSTIYPRRQYTMSDKGVISISAVNLKALISDKIFVAGGLSLRTNTPLNLQIVQYKKDTSRIKETTVNDTTSAVLDIDTDYIRIVGDVIDSVIDNLVLYIYDATTPKPLFPMPYKETFQQSVNTTINKQSIGMNTEISTPKKQYVMKNTDSPFFFIPMSRKWRPEDYIHRLDCLSYIATAPNIKNIIEGAWVNLATAESRYSFYLFDSEYQAIKKHDVSFVVGDATTNNGNVIVAPIGDSLTDINSQYSYANTICPNLTFVGMLKSAQGLMHEGRSGWTLEQYMTLIKSPVEYGGFSPFLHPVADYKYYGCTKFWIYSYANPLANGKAKLKGDEVGGFNPVTGLRNTPNINDVMYNYANSRFEVWNGSAWVLITESTLGAFTFNYGKYLSTWLITQPNIVMLMLGTNDYTRNHWYDAKNTLNAKFTAWYNTIIASVQLVSSSIKVVLLIAPYQSTLSGTTDDKTRSNNMSLYENRKNLINVFDARESEKIYVLDVGSAVDPETDFGIVTQDYVTAGTKKTWMLGKVVDVTHMVSSGFDRMGMRVSAFIQATR